MSEPSPQPFQWRADMVHPSHFEVLFPALGPAAVARLRRCTRLAGRLACQVADPLTLPPEAEATEFERLALQSPERIDEAGRFMGAVWHGRTIQRCIDSQAVAELDARIGRAARLFGLRGASLAVTAAQPASASALGDAIVADGRACLVAWREELGETYRRLADLKLPCRGLPAAAPARQAQPIIAYVAQELADAR